MALWLLLLLFKLPHGLLLHGTSGAAFRGSHATLGDRDVQVVGVAEGLWLLRHQGELLRRPWGSFQVDFCVCPEALQPLPPALAVCQGPWGRGLQATRPLQGELFREAPFLVAREGLGPSAVAAAPKELQEIFEELSGEALRQEDMTLARWQCNCQRLSVPRVSGIYRIHSLLQHSCEPNCAVGVLYSTGEVLVRAVRPILEGEMLTRNYEAEGFLELPHLQRQSYLFERRGFKCTCSRCVREASS